MDKKYKHERVERGIYGRWENAGYFKPEVNPNGEAYSIILPPPNANAPLHFGHAMYVVEDILIRYKRMQGYSALWLPGADHAGFETQFVFEKKLQEKGKSRMDYERDTLFQMIWDYVQENKTGMEDQLRKLGFSLDWSRAKFTLDPEVVKLIYKTFYDMYKKGLVYRDRRLVNYCTFDGTSFSDLEVEHKVRKSPLYYIKYGPLVVATTRPETKFGDTAVAVNPGDKRYKKFVGKEIEIETLLGKAKMKVIGDEMVDPEFGTGVVKITPAHDFNDFEVAKRHNLPMRQVIGFDGKMNASAGRFEGVYAKVARREIVEEMKGMGLIEKIDENYTHSVGVCYKCKNVLEPLPREQWFVKVKPLCKQALSAVKKGDIRIFPKNFETVYMSWLENLHDWNISRQTVWGMRIPAWRCRECRNKSEVRSDRAEGLKDKDVIKSSDVNSNETIEKFDDVSWIVTEGEEPDKCPNCGSSELVQDSDTFDTWFSSSQWPFVALQANDKHDFEKFYPTNIMETGYDILKAWVSRMVMMGYLVTGQKPFSDVVLHGLVNDPHGKKMSKSKGNVVNPMELIDEYGADAVRFALVYGTAFGHDQSLSYDKLRSMRNFVNKLWNIGRFIEMNQIQNSKFKIKNYKLHEVEKIAKHRRDHEMVEKVEKLVKDVSLYIDKYDFNHASQALYDFTWHVFADIYIEDVKNRIDEDSFLVLCSLYFVVLKLLHPFVPFVTEEIYDTLYDEGGMLIVSEWPLS